MKKILALFGSLISTIGFTAQAQQVDRRYSIDLSKLNQMELQSLYDKLLLNNVPVGVDIYEEEDNLTFDCVGCDLRELDAFMAIDRPDNYVTR